MALYSFMSLSLLLSFSFSVLWSLGLLHLIQVASGHGGQLQIQHSQSRQAGSWALVAIAIVLTGARFYARFYVVRAFYWDDLFHILALTFFIIGVATFTVGLGYADAIVAYESEKTDVIPNYASFQQLLLAWLSMTWCTSWAIKAAFLMLYRKIFSTSRIFIWYWWGVAVFTFLTFLAVIIPQFAYCGDSAADNLNEAKCDSPTVEKLQLDFLIYSTCLSIGTDIAIMVLPLAMLRKMRMTRMHKLGLAVVFSLTWVLIGMSIFRVIVSAATVSNESLNFISASLESGFAVWVSCIPSLHVLIRSKGNRRKNAHSDEQDRLRYQQSRQHSTYTETPNSASRSRTSRSLNPELPASNDIEMPKIGKPA